MQRTYPNSFDQKKKKKVTRFILCSFNALFKATIIKPVQHWHKDKESIAAKSNSRNRPVHIWKIDFQQWFKMAFNLNGNTGNWKKF